MIYTLFMALAFLSAWIASRLTSKSSTTSSPNSLPLDRSQSLFIGLVGFSCAMIAAKLPFILLNVSVLNHAGAVLASGKTVLLGLVGGYAGVELAKWHLGIKSKTGDRFAVPVAIGIGVGRLGCFFAGCCFGVPTQLPWGVVFSTVDTIARHPIQLYECLFHLSMAGILLWMLQHRLLKNQLIKFYFIAYFVFRFATEFIRPEIHWTLGLTAYQWAIIFLIPVFMWLWIRDMSSHAIPE